MLMINKNDPRGAKAVALATDAGQWIKCRTKDGRKAYGVPSSSEPNRYYLTGRSFCTCPARMRRPGLDCKHMLAVQLHCELVREQDDAQIYDDIFARFDDDPAPLARILGKPAPWTRRQRGVIPAAQIERED